MPITVAAGTTPNGIDLDAGMILACRTATASFNKLGNGTMRLTNPLNTANFTLTQGRVASGRHGRPGQRRRYARRRHTAIRRRRRDFDEKFGICIGGGFVSTIQVLTNGANLTLNGTISGALVGYQGLLVSGSGITDTSSTLTLGGTNTYSGITVVSGNAVLAIPNIADAHTPCPIGEDLIGDGLRLGSDGSRGTLLLTGTNLGGYSTNRHVVVAGLYPNAGGAIGVQNASTNLTVSGPIVNTGITTAGSLIKTGPGTLTLLNQTNNYAGGTYVEAGTLVRWEFRGRDPRQQRCDGPARGHVPDRLLGRQQRRPDRTGDSRRRHNAASNLFRPQRHQFA